jgi:general secretion pathway protein C
MKRLPLMTSFLMFIIFCMSLSYWGMQMFKPKVRPVSAPQSTSAFGQIVGQWGAVFGRSPMAQMAASNYQLKGIVVALHAQDSVAIISADGKPEQALAIGRELSPGVKLLEVHRTHIVVSESGVDKQIDLPKSSALSSGINVYSPPPPPPAPAPAANMPPSNQVLPGASLPAPPSLPPPQQQVQQENLR